MAEFRERERERERDCRRDAQRERERERESERQRARVGGSATFGLHVSRLLLFVQIQRCVSSAALVEPTRWTPLSALPCRQLSCGSPMVCLLDVVKSVISGKGLQSKLQQRSTPKPPALLDSEAEDLQFSESLAIRVWIQETASWCVWTSMAASFDSARCAGPRALVGVRGIGSHLDLGWLTQGWLD